MPSTPGGQQFWVIDKWMKWWLKGTCHSWLWSHIKSIISWHLYINMSLKCAWYIYNNMCIYIYLYYTKNITNRSRGRTQPIYVWHLSFPPLQGSGGYGYMDWIWGNHMKLWNDPIQISYGMGAGATFRDYEIHHLGMCLTGHSSSGP